MAYRFDETEVRRLLDLYMEGETSLSQETLLREYFCSDRELPGDLAYARMMFGGLAGLREETMPQAEGRTASLYPSQRLLPTWVRWAGMAAACVVGVWMGVQLASGPGLHQPAALSENQTAFEENFYNEGPQRVYGYVDGRPVTDCLEAVETSRRALGLVGESLSRPAAYFSSYNAN